MHTHFIELHSAQDLQSPRVAAEISELLLWVSENEIGVILKDCTGHYITTAQISRDFLTLKHVLKLKMKHEIKSRQVAFSAAQEREESRFQEEGPHALSINGTYGPDVYSYR